LLAVNVSRAIALLALLVLVAAPIARAGQPAASDTGAAAIRDNMEMGEVLALLRQQQQELAAQRQLLEAQSRKIETLTQELDGLRGAPASQPTTVAAAAPPAVDSDEPTAPSTGPESSAPAATTAPEAAQSTAEQDAETGKSVAAAQSDNPSRDSLKDFPGAWHLPGTNAALAIGGFVKTDVVYNFDPLQIADRFIVGSIPVGVSESTGDEAQSSITADQSRLNFDLREQSEFGTMRAFIEGDFAGSGETFRLRHAFGQWRRMLAGKTWSTFVDPEASPEEIDFEGLNARINVRQAQIRVMPKFGQKYEMQLSIEDPNPQIQNGTGITRNPDAVVAGRFSLYERLHMKLALIGREIRGESETGNVEKQYAWGTSLSGRFSTPSLGPRDNIQFQFNTGDGIGRYVNDLSSIGNYDGIFDPGTGELQLFDVTAGYVALQHWWGGQQLRSNFIAGYVDVNSPGFLGGDAYDNTLRFSSNLIWSPIPRIDIGGEYLWGQRENIDGDSGQATQLQFAVRYRF
jgi:hypothetical protein